MRVNAVTSPDFSVKNTSTNKVHARLVIARRGRRCQSWLDNLGKEGSLEAVNRRKFGIPPSNLIPHPDWNNIYELKCLCLRLQRFYWHVDSLAGTSRFRQPPKALSQVGHVELSKLRANVE